VVAGRLRARTVERGSRLLLEPDAGPAVGAVALNRPEGLTTVLEASEGAWTVHEVERIIRHRKAHLSVRDEGGMERAKVWFEGQRRPIELQSERLVWEAPSLLPFRLGYRIEGLFAARSWVPALSAARRATRIRHPFTVDVLPPLVGRQDAPLVLLIATWLTWEDFSSDVV
jgi:hypothetical protein